VSSCYVRTADAALAIEMVACDGIASLCASVVVPEVQRLVMASQATVTIASASFAALRGGCACSHAFPIRVGRNAGSRQRAASFPRTRRSRCRPRRL
jgi:hypothetical protein